MKFSVTLFIRGTVIVFFAWAGYYYQNIDSDLDYFLPRSCFLKLNTINIIYSF